MSEEHVLFPAADGRFVEYPLEDFVVKDSGEIAKDLGYDDAGDFLFTMCFLALALMPFAIACDLLRRIAKLLKKAEEQRAVWWIPPILFDGGGAA